MEIGRVICHYKKNPERISQQECYYFPKQTVIMTSLNFLSFCYYLVLICWCWQIQFEYHNIWKSWSEIFSALSWQLFVFGFLNESPHRIKKYTTSRTRFTITCLKTYASRIAVGDCRDGVLFYSYHEVQVDSIETIHFYDVYFYGASLLLPLILVLIYARILGSWNWSILILPNG